VEHNSHPLFFGFAEQKTPACGLESANGVVPDYSCRTFPKE
jgi:hypothetical protein